MLADKGILFSEENNRVRCFAHILNLSCQAALSVIKKIGTNAALDIDDFEESSTDDEDTENLNRIMSSIYHRIKTT
ncbi:unnamed protein product, partial [Allacma fusca]